LQPLERHHFDCECGSDEHTFKFVFDPDDGELYLSAYLSQYRGFFGRVLEAVKYVFGYTSKYGHWDVTILNRDDTARLAALCQRSVEARDAYTKAHLETDGDSNTYGHDFSVSSDFHIPSMDIQPPAEKSELPPPLDLPGSVWHGARITAS
jgi:hypothetical protein